MGKRKRSCLIVVEEQDDESLDAGKAPVDPRSCDVERQGGAARRRSKKDKKTRTQAGQVVSQGKAGASHRHVTVSLAQRAAEQAAEFLAELEQSVVVALGGIAGVADSRGCSGFHGPRAGPCVRCGRMATVHQLRLQHRPADLRHRPSLLGRIAWLLLRARAALSQIRSLGWCDEMLRSSAECWAIATTLPRKPSVGAEMMSEHLAAEPLEVTRWWKRLAAGGDSNALSAGMVNTEQEMESVARLLCHVNEAWFRLYYYTCTEEPAALAANGGSGGVPGFSEWMHRAVGATVSSAWYGGVTQTVEWVKAQAGVLESVSSAKKWSVDLAGSDAAAVLRRGCAAAVQGAAALYQPFGDHPAKTTGGSISSSSSNELLKIYDCMVVETQVLFRHDSRLAALGQAHWASLTAPTARPCVGYSGLEHPCRGLCIVCAEPTVSSGSKGKKTQQQASRIRCSYCGGNACAPSCTVTCVGCSKPVCIRCAQPT